MNRKWYFLSVAGGIEDVYLIRYDSKAYTPKILDMSTAIEKALIRVNSAHICWERKLSKNNIRSVYKEKFYINAFCICYIRSTPALDFIFVYSYLSD